MTLLIKVRYGSQHDKGLLYGITYIYTVKAVMDNEGSCLVKIVQDYHLCQANYVSVGYYCCALYVCGKCGECIFIFVK